MARSQRSSRLENRTARLKLPLGTRHFVTIGDSLALAYRRTERGYGTWQARYWDGSKYHYRNLGEADDFKEDNGEDVLTYYQAQDAARKMANDAKVNAGVVRKPLTVAEAAASYRAWFRDHRKSVKATEHVIDAHILPALGKTVITDLKAPAMRAWLDRLAVQPARVRTSRLGKSQKFKAAPKTADEKRARRSTANRILTVLKAILNKAFKDGRVPDDVEWRRVEPFENVDEARIRFLTDAEATRLVNACPADLRRLVRVALLTGGRWGELAGLRAVDVDLRAAHVYFAPSKTSRARHVPLNPEGVQLFREVATGKTGDDLLFIRADGERWGKNHHVRPLTEACKVGKINPRVRFHEMRHTYASHLAQAGVDLLTISKLLGHADTRITAKHYAHLANKTLATAVTKLPSFEADTPMLAVVKNDAPQRARSKS